MNFFFSSRRRHTFFFQAEDGIRDRSPSRGLGDVYKRQNESRTLPLKKNDSDSVVDTSSCKCNTIDMVIVYVGAESGRDWRCDRVHVLHQPGVAGVTLWRPPKHPSFCFSLSIFAISPIDQPLTPCKVIMIALN